MVLMQLLVPVCAWEQDSWEKSPVVLAGSIMNVQLETVNISDIISKFQSWAESTCIELKI